MTNGALGGVEFHLVARRRLLDERCRIGEVGRLRQCGRREQRERERQDQTAAGHWLSLENNARSARKFLFQARGDAAGTKADTSPPMPAIWRTNVAVIGRTSGEAGRNTVCTFGAMVAFMPAICIS